MDQGTRNHADAVTLSVLLHAVLIVCLLVSVNFSRTRVAAPPHPAAIEAVMLDQSVIEQFVPPTPMPDPVADPEQQREAAAREQQQRDERLRIESEQAEAAESEAAREAQLELDRQAAEAELIAREQAEKEAAARREAERQEAERAEAERAAEEQRRAEAQLERERIAEQNRITEEQRLQAEQARLQAELEAELMSALAAEEALNRARNSGELDRYLRQIQTAINDAWNRPASVFPGLECVVTVKQIPSGDVTGVSIGRCNGDEAVRRSLEAAVLRASPLPRPSSAVLFERVLEIIFVPDF